MSINIFSIVLVVFIIWNIIKSKGLKNVLFNMTILTITIELYIELGYFAEINGILIGYRLITEIILFIISLICIIKNKKRAISKNALMLLLIITIGILNLILIPVNIQFANGNVSWDDFIRGGIFEYISFNSFVIQETVQFLIFIINLLAIYLSFEKEDYKKVVIDFTKIIKFMLCVGIIEYVIKYILNSNMYNQFCNTFFGLGRASVLELSKRGTGYILQGFTTEASHYSYVLMISTLILFASNVITNKEKKWILLSILLMMASMSFSSVLFIFGLIVFCILYWLQKSKNNELKFFKIISILIICLILFIVIYSNLGKIFNNLSENDFLQRRIKSTIEEVTLILNGDWKTSTTSLEWSNRVRLGSAYETLKLVKYRPLFGLGVATVASHGSTTMLLAGIGILGTYYWIKYVFFTRKDILNNINIKYYILGIGLWLTLNILNSMGLRPFYEVTAFILMCSYRIIFDKK